MIKEEQILKFAKGLFLRKSLYYSVLILLLLLFTTLIITGVNYLFFPPLKLIQSVVLLCGLLFTLVLILLPLKFLIFYFFIKKLSDQYLAKVVRSYDEGRLQQSLDLNKQQELGKWSSRVSLRESQIILKILIEVNKVKLAIKEMVFRFNFNTNTLTTCKWQGVRQL
jgi:Cu/Ag efflux pump CusA